MGDEITAASPRINTPFYLRRTYAKTFCFSCRPREIARTRHNSVRPLAADAGSITGALNMFAARVRAGFIPATRREVFAKIKGLKIAKCPFTNLPEKEPGRWGQGLTAEKMKSCNWVKPEVVVCIDFAEWTGADKLRHTRSQSQSSASEV